MGREGGRGLLKRKKRRGLPPPTVITRSDQLSDMGQARNSAKYADACGWNPFWRSSVFEAKRDRAWRRLSFDKCLSHGKERSSRTVRTVAGGGEDRQRTIRDICGHRVVPSGYLVSFPETLFQEKNWSEERVQRGGGTSLGRRLTNIVLVIALFTFLADSRYCPKWVIEAFAPRPRSDATRSPVGRQSAVISSPGGPLLPGLQYPFWQTINHLLHPNTS